MPTVIDSLVVTLGLDASKFTSGQRGAREDLSKTRQNANAAAKEISASGAQAAQFFGKLRNEALSLAAVFVGGMGVKALVQNINTADAATGRLSRNIGVSVETLTTWGAVIERAGGSATEAATTFSNLTRAYQEYQATGQTAITPYLQRLGINNASELRDIPALLMKIGDTIERERMSPQQANFLMAGAGLDEGMRNFLLMSRQRREATLAESAALGAARKKDTDAAEALEAAFLKTKQAILDVGRSILTELSGPLQEVLKAVNLWLSSDENRKWLREEIERVGVGIRDFLRDFNAIVVAMGGWKDVTEALFAVWVGTKFLGVIASLTRILTLLAAIPGSGVTAGTLALLGIGALANQLPRANTETGENTVTPLTPGGLNPRVMPWMPRGPLSSDDVPADAGEAWWRRFMPSHWFRPAYGPGSGGGNRGGGLPGPRVSGTGTGPRGIRNNNPLNLEYRPDQGARGTDGRFGVYDSMEGGVSAATRQLERYGSHYGLTTINGIIGRWAPAGENNVNAYALSVSRSMGIDANAQLDLSNPATMASLIAAMARVENGRAIDPEAVRRGVAMAHGGAGVGPRRTLTREETTGLPPSFMPPAGSALPPPTLIPPPGGTIPMPPGPLASGSQSETHIGQIAIHTQATDANGIARGIAPALRRFGLVAQGNSGLA